MSNGAINPVEFGKLLQSAQQNGRSIKTLFNKVDEINKAISGVKVKIALLSAGSGTFGAILSVVFNHYFISGG